MSANPGMQPSLMWIYVKPKFEPIVPYLGVEDL